MLFKASLPVGSPYGWSRDGRFILFSQVDPKTSFDVWVLPMVDGRPGKPYPFLASQFEERNAFFSPDGRWVAYSSTESGSAEVYVRPFPGPGGQWQVSTGGGIQPMWRVDGLELYFVSPDGRLMTRRSPPPAMHRADRRRRCSRRMVGGGADNYSRLHGVAPDGRFSSTRCSTTRRCRQSRW